MNEVTTLYIVAGVVFTGLAAWVGWVMATRKQRWALTPEERDALLGDDDADGRASDAPAEAKGSEDDAADPPPSGGDAGADEPKGEAKGEPEAKEPRADEDPASGEDDGEDEPPAKKKAAAKS
ncbi:MAG: hypothetical protein JNL38_34395 [Myxococcales bacterium]|jgi:hypothetical protein|nr:hypothetical protein [Myxococcales bacterium]